MPHSQRESTHSMAAWVHGGGAELLRRLGICDGDRVLDFGCGPGGYVLPLAQVVGPRGRVLAADKNAAHLASLGQRIESSPARACVDIVLTGGDLTLDWIDDASLDAALLFDVLQHVEDWVGLFAALRRTLAPAGRLLINPSRLSHPGRVDLERLESTLAVGGFAIERRVRGRIVHYDRLREEEVLVCRAR